MAKSLLESGHHLTLHCQRRSAQGHAQACAVEKAQTLTDKADMKTKMNHDSPSHLIPRLAVAHGP